jgi:hypothetical protein
MKTSKNIRGKKFKVNNIVPEDIYADEYIMKNGHCLPKAAKVKLVFRNNKVLVASGEVIVDGYATTTILYINKQDARIIVKKLSKLFGISK